MIVGLIIQQEVGQRKIVGQVMSFTVLNQPEYGDFWEKQTRICPPYSIFLNMLIRKL